MRVAPPDLEDWLTRHIRAAALADDLVVEVGNKEPARLALPLVKPLIVVRDDSGPRRSHVTFERSIGASVLAGSRQNDNPAKELARWLASVLFDLDIVLVDGSPIAAVDVDGCNGPYAITEPLDVSRQYLTAQYIASGSWAQQGSPT